MYLLAVDLGVPWLLELSSKISDLINWIWLNLVLASLLPFGTFVLERRWLR